MPCEALELRPVRLLQDEDTVKVRYLDTGREFSLDPERPVEALQAVTANDDATVVEVVDSRMMAVRQVGEDGVPQTVLLSPSMASELSRLIDSFVLVGPNAVGTWADGRDAA